MIVSIIGWYGTETLGDRAILDGILCVLDKIEPCCKVNLGSLFPFYSQRTLREEESVFHESAPKIEIAVFNLKNKKDHTKKCGLDCGLL